MLDQYTYVFVIGTLFAMLDAYNNGASKLLPPRLASFLAAPSFSRLPASVC